MNPISWKWRIYRTGLTQKEFCEKAKIKTSQLSVWITGKKKPHPKNIKKVEEILLKIEKKLNLE